MSQPLDAASAFSDAPTQIIELLSAPREGFSAPYGAVAESETAATAHPASGTDGNQQAQNNAFVHTPPVAGSSPEPETATVALFAERPSHEPGASSYSFAEFVIETGSLSTGQMQRAIRPIGRALISKPKFGQRGAPRFVIDDATAGVLNRIRTLMVGSLAQFLWSDRHSARCNLAGNTP